MSGRLRLPAARPYCIAADQSGRMVRKGSAMTSAAPIVPHFRRQAAYCTTLGSPLTAAVPTTIADLLERARSDGAGAPARSEEHTSEIQSLMRIYTDVFCLKKKNNELQK